MQQLDFVFAVPTAYDIRITTDPSDEMLASWTVVAHVAKGDYETTILRIDGLVAVSMQARRQRFHFRPCFALVIA